MRHALFLAATIAGTAFLGNNSALAGSYAAVEINMRAGPSTRYPAIDLVRGGMPLNVLGCTNGYRWCDVEASGRRGWVSGAYIEIEHDTQRLRVPAYVQVVHEPVVPTVSFSINTYWSEHYSDREFYSEIHDWDEVDWEADAPPPGWDPNW